MGKNLERIIEGLHKELFDYILPVEEVKPVDRKNNGKRSNDWDLLDPERSLDEIVVEALKTVVIPSSRRLTRRDKRPFVTSYQLASIISKMFPHYFSSSVSVAFAMLKELNLLVVEFATSCQNYHGRIVVSIGSQFFSYFLSGLKFVIAIGEISAIVIY